MRKRRESKRKILFIQYVIGVGLLLTVITFSLLYMIQLAQQPYDVAKSQSSQIARDYADLRQVDSFAIYNGKEGYYSLEGTDSKGKRLGVLIAKKSDQIHVYELDKGTSEEEARKIAKENGAEKIERITFGYRDNQPIWEVKSGRTYYTIGFETASLMSKEGI